MRFIFLSSLIPIFHALQVRIEFASSYELSVIFRPISLVDIGHNIIFIFKLFIASATQHMKPDVRESEFSHASIAQGSIYPSHVSRHTLIMIDVANRMLLDRFDRLAQSFRLVSFLSCLGCHMVHLLMNGRFCLCDLPSLAFVAM